MLVEQAVLATLAEEAAMPADVLWLQGRSALRVVSAVVVVELALEP